MEFQYKPMYWDLPPIPEVERGEPSHDGTTKVAGFIDVLLKARVRHIKPIPKNTAETKRAELKMERAVRRVFHQVKPKVVAEIKIRLTNLLKASPSKVSLDATATVSLTGLNAIASEPIITNYGDVAVDAGMAAFVSIGAKAQPDIINQINERSMAWARDRAAELVGMKWDENGDLVDNPNAEWAIDQSTRDMLRETIRSGMDEGMGVDELTAAIEDGYAFSDLRARMIARTEISYAHNQGALIGYLGAKDIGVNVKKEWILGEDPCDICLDNADEGPIDLEELFPSGDDAPPAHPNCECAVAPVVEGDEGFDQPDEGDGEDQVEAVAKGVEEEERDERGRWTSGGGAPVSTMTHSEVEASYIRAQYVDISSKAAADTVVSSLMNGPQVSQPLWVFAMRDAGITEENIGSKTDAEIKSALDAYAASGHEPSAFFAYSLINQVTDKADQERVAQAILHAANDPTLSVGGGNMRPEYQMAADQAGRYFRGDVVDQLADARDWGQYSTLTMYSKDYDKFLPAFVGSWTMMGGTDAYRRAYAATNNFVDNKGGGSFWTGDGSQRGGLTDSEKVVSENLRGNLFTLYNNTQEFYQGKLGANVDLAAKTVDLGRGVGGHFDSYTPAPVESWTRDRYTVDRFGKMMSGRDGSYTALSAKVSYKSVLMSWESLKGTWPEEASLKGKKEFVIFGGSLTNVTITKK